MTPRVQIEVNERGFGSRILIDWRELPNVKAFTLKVDVESSSLVVEFAPFDIEMSGHVGVLKGIQARWP